LLRSKQSTHHPQMNKAGPSRKRKRGKNRNLLIEDDDDACEFVTFEEVTINTRGGPVKKLNEVPLRIQDSKEGPSNQPEKFPSSQINDFEEVRPHLDYNEPKEKLSKNKVIRYYIGLKAEMLNTIFLATNLDSGIRLPR
jgi:hypothetical protein